jgi:branched-chain amino acid aminotransferase
MGDYFDIERGLSVMVSGWRRNDDNAIPARAKATGGYVNAALAIADAQDAGFDEAILLTHAGRVVEAAIENLFVVRDGKLVTPPLEDGPLTGITRAAVIALATDDGIAFEEASLTLDDLLAADEVFCTSTAAEVASVGEVDGRRYPAPGPVTRRLHAAFRRVVLGEDPRFRHWLDPVALAEEPTLSR